MIKFKYMKEEIEDDRVSRLCYEHLKSFVDIYPKDVNSEGTHYHNKIPDNVKVTVYCDDDDMTRGFLVNLYHNELGLEELIAKKWILHSDLEKLCGESIN